MHKKSCEAAATLETEEQLTGDSKSESIAALRLRAKEHNAKLLTALGADSNESLPTQPDQNVDTVFNLKDL